MKITACCITWNRPRELERLIECFNRQTYSNREMIVLDDAGQHPDEPSGDRWSVISVKKRFNSLGSKRNAVACMAGKTDALAVWDTDDIYLPWALEACVEALKDSAWTQARQVLEWNGDGSWKRCESFNRKHPSSFAYHGAWAFLRSSFLEVGGYPITGEEDNPLANRMYQRFGLSSDSISSKFPDPWYAYSRGDGHISTLYQKFVKERKDFHEAAWEHLGMEKIQPTTLNPSWDRDYCAIPIPSEVCRRVW